MDTLIADIVILFFGLFIGAVATVLVGLKVVQMAVAKILRKMVEQGFFYHEGIRYTVKPYHLKGTRH